MRHPIAVFGRSDARRGSEEYNLAFELGRLLGRSGYDLVNGGYGGAMEASGRGAREAGARVTGVTVAYYGSALDYVDCEEAAENFWQRTRRMLELGHGFVALPGGTGTLSELACAWEGVQKRLMDRKPLALFAPFWGPLFERMCPSSDDRARCGGAVRLVATPSEAVRFFDEFFGRTATA